MRCRYWFGAATGVSPAVLVPIVKLDRLEGRLGGGASVACNLAALRVKTAPPWMICFAHDVAGPRCSARHFYRGSGSGGFGAGQRVASGRDGSVRVVMPGRCLMRGTSPKRPRAATGRIVRARVGQPSVALDISPAWATTTPGSSPATCKCAGVPVTICFEIVERSLFPRNYT